MDDATIKAKAKAAKLPRIMWDTQKFRAALATLLESEVAALRADAERYRWLRSRQGLTLRTEKQPNVWRRMDGTEFNVTHSLAEGGTQHAPADSLDALVDAAMLAARIRDA